MYQGLFRKRQPDIARDYGRICQEELLTPEHIISSATRDAGGSRMAQTILARSNERIDTNLKLILPLPSVEATEEMLDKAKHHLLAKVAKAFWQER